MEQLKKDLTIYAYACAIADSTALLDDEDISEERRSEIRINIAVLEQMLKEAELNYHP